MAKRKTRSEPAVANDMPAGQQGAGAPDEQALLAAAIVALHIDVPIYSHQVTGHTITLYLYGHSAPVRWTWKYQAAQ